MMKLGAIKKIEHSDKNKIRNMLKSSFSVSSSQNFKAERNKTKETPHSVTSSVLYSALRIYIETKSNIILETSRIFLPGIRKDEIKIPRTPRKTVMAMSKDKTATFINMMKAVKSLSFIDGQLS